MTLYQLPVVGNRSLGFLDQRAMPVQRLWRGFSQLKIFCVSFWFCLITMVIKSICHATLSTVKLWRENTSRGLSKWRRWSWDLARWGARLPGNSSMEGTKFSWSTLESSFLSDLATTWGTASCTRKTSGFSKGLLSATSNRCQSPLIGKQNQTSPQRRSRSTLASTRGKGSVRIFSTQWWYSRVFSAVLRNWPLIWTRCDWKFTKK